MTVPNSRAPITITPSGSAPSSNLPSPVQAPPAGSGAGSSLSGSRGPTVTGSAAGAAASTSSAAPGPRPVAPAAGLKSPPPAKFPGKKVPAVPTSRPLSRPGTPTNAAASPSPLATSSSMASMASGAFVGSPKVPNKKPTGSGQNTPVGRGGSPSPPPNAAGAGTAVGPLSVSPIGGRNNSLRNVPPAPGGSSSVDVASPDRITNTLKQQGQITNLEMQLESLDTNLIDAITANEESRSTCENLIRNLNGIGGVAKMVQACHEMAQDIQNFEAELAALNGEELNLREENVARRAELETAIQCMETLLKDVASPMQRKALADAKPAKHLLASTAAAAAGDRAGSPVIVSVESTYSPAVGRPRMERPPGLRR